MTALFAKILITVRNEVAKVMFLHLPVILSTGWGVSASGYHPWEQTPPPREQAGIPPGTRHPQ